MSLSKVIEFLRPGLDATRDFEVTKDERGELITEWGNAQEQPTQQEIDDALADLTTVNGQTYSQWLAEHGGDAQLTLRRRAREELDEQRAINATLRAAVIELLVYARTTAGNLNALLDGIDSAASLGDVKTAAAAIGNQPVPTFAQARDAIKARIEAGEADS